MAGPATDEDLNARSLRPLSAAEVAVGETLLGDAYNVIVVRVPSVGDRLTDAAFKSLVVQVQCAMVLRVLRNPDGKLEESVDDYRYRLDQAVSTGALYLSDAEAALLSSGDGVSDGAWTVTSRRNLLTGFWSSTDVWTPYA